MNPRQIDQISHIAILKRNRVNNTPITYWPIQIRQLWSNKPGNFAILNHLNKSKQMKERCFLSVAK